MEPATEADFLHDLFHFKENAINKSPTEYGVHLVPWKVCEIWHLHLIQGLEICPAGLPNTFQKPIYIPLCIWRGIGMLCRKHHLVMNPEHIIIITLTTINYEVKLAKTDSIIQTIGNIVHQSQKPVKIPRLIMWNSFKPM